MSHNPAHQTATARRYQVAATAAVNSEADKHADWLFFLHTVNDMVHPATDEVTANQMRPVLYRHFQTVNQRRKQSALYNSLLARSILTRIGEEASTDTDGGNDAKMAGIFLVDRHRLMAAIANPARKAPRTPRATTDRELRQQARREYAAILDTAPAPSPVVYASATTERVRPEGAALVGSWSGSSANVLGADAADALF